MVHIPDKDEVGSSTLPGPIDSEVGFTSANTGGNALSSDFFSEIDNGAKRHVSALTKPRRGVRRGVECRPRKGWGPTYRVDAKTGCWVWLRTVDKEGYGYFRFAGKAIRAHRHFYKKHKGEIPAGLEIDHLCRNRKCVNPEHLEAVTHIENCRRGDLVQVLEINQVREIRRLSASGISNPAIAERFEISTAYVANIVALRVWREAAAPSPETGVGL